MILSLSYDFSCPIEIVKSIYIDKLVKTMMIYVTEYFGLCVLSSLSFHFCKKYVFFEKWFVCWLVVFYVPSTARSFRDGAPIYCPLRREALFLYRSYQESNPGPSRGSPLHYPIFFFECHLKINHCNMINNRYVPLIYIL